MSEESSMSVSLPEFDPAIVVNFPGYGDVRFSTFAETIKFVSSQEAAWKWLPSDRNNYKRFVDEFRRDLADGSKGEPRRDFADRVRNKLNEMAALFPHSDTIRYRFVRRCVEQYGASSIEWLVDTGSLKHMLQQSRDNRELIACVQLISAEKIHSDEYGPQIEKLTEQLEELRVLLEKRAQEFEDLKAEYKSISDLKEPASYWDTRSNYHATREKYWGIASAVISVIWLFVLMCNYNQVHDSIVSESARVTEEPRTTQTPIATSKIAIATGTVPVSTPVASAINSVVTTPNSEANRAAEPIQISPWYLLSRSFPLVALSVAAFWCIRIFVRNYLSHAHLRMDADERIVLTQTYQTLLRGDRALNEKGFDIILSQLFRHSANGLIKDDAAPGYPPVVELMTRSSS